MQGYCNTQLSTILLAAEHCPRICVSGDATTGRLAILSELEQRMRSDAGSEVQCHGDLPHTGNCDRFGRYSSILCVP